MVKGPAGFVSFLPGSTEMARLLELSDNGLSRLARSAILP
jgi:hypothetical protein